MPNESKPRIYDSLDAPPAKRPENAMQVTAEQDQVLPWLCPQHPQAMIRRSWDQTQYVMNGYPAGEPLRSNFRYECAECGMTLAPPTTDAIRAAKDQGARE